jgi:drug/metabolite transporter (DMT)-like permease
MVTLVPANVAAMAVMAVPVVGVLSSAWILGEPVGPIEAAALVLVVGGLFLLLRRAGA